MIIFRLAHVLGSEARAVAWLDERILHTLEKIKVLKNENSINTTSLRPTDDVAGTQKFNTDMDSENVLESLTRCGMSLFLTSNTITVLKFIQKLTAASPV